MGPKASILILEQGNSVGPGSREEQCPFSPDESAQTGQRPQSREAPLSRPVGNKQAGRYPSQWPSFEGPGGTTVAGWSQWACWDSGWILGARSQSWASSNRHLRAWSLCASGRIWLRMPPSTLDVASVATIIGFTTVGGSCRITPPTAPVSPFCSWPLDATSQMV